MKHLLLLLALCAFGCDSSYEKVTLEPPGAYGSTCDDDRVLTRYNEPDEELKEIYLKKARTQAKNDGCWVDEEKTKTHSIVFACCLRT
jgi:hypothetical protein